MTRTFVVAELVMMGILEAGGIDPDIVVESTSSSLTPPLVRVRRVPGEPRTMFDDPAHIEVLTFGATFQAAQALTEQVANIVRFAYAKAAPLPGGLSVCVDATDVVLPPVEVPWPNPDVRVFQATYRVVTRAQPF